MFLVTDVCRNLVILAQDDGMVELVEYFRQFVFQFPEVNDHAILVQLLGLQKDFGDVAVTMHLLALLGIARH